MISMKKSTTLVLLILGAEQLSSAFGYNKWNHHHHHAVGGSWDNDESGWGAASGVSLGSMGIPTFEREAMNTALSHNIRGFAGSGVRYLYQKYADGDYDDDDEGNNIPSGANMGVPLFEQQAMAHAFSHLGSDGHGVRYLSQAENDEELDEENEETQSQNNEDENEGEE